MKRFLWITACCAGISAFQALADEDYAPPTSPQVSPDPQGGEWTASPPPPALGDQPQLPAVNAEHVYRYAVDPGSGAMPDSDGFESMHRRPEGVPSVAPYHQWGRTNRMRPPEQRGFGPSELESYPSAQEWSGDPGPHGYGLDPGYGYAPAQAYRTPHGYEESPGYGYAPPQAYRVPPGYGESPGYGYPPPQTYRMPRDYEESPGYGYPPPQTYQMPHGYAEPPGYGYPGMGYRQPMMAPDYRPEYGYGTLPGGPDYDYPAFQDAPGTPDNYRYPHRAQDYDRFPGYPTAEGESGVWPGGFGSTRDFTAPPAPPGYDRPLPPYGVPGEPDYGYPSPEYPAPTAPDYADPFARPLPPAPSEAEALPQPQPVTPAVIAPAPSTEMAVEQIQSESSPSESTPPVPILLDQTAPVPPPVQENNEPEPPQATQPPVNQEPQPAVEDSAPEST